MALIHLDTKKRVAIGKLLQGRDVNTFDAEVLPSGEILLKPMVMIPEHWIYRNPKALASLKLGINQAAAGQTRPYSEIKNDWDSKAKSKKRV
jgi:hypothetical protein